MHIYSITWSYFNHIVKIFSDHIYLAYIFLFLGSYFETLIFIGFFILGEPFFYAGSVLGGIGILNIWFVSLACISGGIAGDSSSYWIGRKFGIKIFSGKNRFFNIKNYERGVNMFKKYGNKFIFIARLLGPLSWITPFLSGIYDVPYGTFLKYNIPGVIVGIGEFMIIGYFLGNTYSSSLPAIHKYTFIAVIIFIATAILYELNKKIKAR